MTADDATPAAFDGTEEDRMVSRRVDHPTAATTEDAPAYRAAAAGPTPSEADTDSGGSGGAADRARRDLDADDESEPTRSE